MKTTKSLITSFSVKMASAKKKTQPVIQGMIVTTGLSGGLYRPGDRNVGDLRKEGGRFG